MEVDVRRCAGKEVFCTIALRPKAKAPNLRRRQPQIGPIAGPQRLEACSMEAFEHIIKVMLEAQGYVVTNNVKFPVRMRTRRADRAEYQTHGYEMDIVAARHNSLLLGSVKSFLGSHGVSRQGFQRIADTSKKNHFGQYRVFNDAVIRQGIFREASKRYGYPKRRIQLALYVGKFYSQDEEPIRRHLRRIRLGAGPVKVVGLDEIVRGVLKAAESKTYANDPVLMTIKSLHEAGYVRETSE